MSSRVAFVDLDDVIADNSTREQQANALVDAAIAPLHDFLDESALKQIRTSVFYSEKAFYNPELVPYDTLIDGVAQVLDKLADQGYQLILLSSRPESMRSATEQWLLAHNIDLCTIRLILKPAASQYVKTTVWKASTVDMFARFLEASLVIFVDDDQKNIDEVVKHLDTRYYTINVYTDLASAIQG